MSNPNDQESLETMLTPAASSEAEHQSTSIQTREGETQRLSDGQPGKKGQPVHTGQVAPGGQAALDQSEVTRRIPSASAIDVPSDHTIPLPDEGARPADRTHILAAGELPDPPVPAFSLSGYDMLEELGRGGMGVVYKARQRRPSRLVAIKTIHAPQIADSEQIARFHAEADAAGRLDHRGIVPVYEVGQQAGIHFFSMGFVDGGSLEGKCRERILSCREAAEICRQIADALEYAHQHGVIHRDIKPHNILIGLDGNPRITDFGLAKLSSRNSDLTGTGQIMGTAAYMPPEQATGNTAEAGPMADVYALGATLYRCITGRPPFQASSTMEVLRQVVEDDPVPPRRLNQEVDEDLQTIILKCLEKKEASRYPSAGALRDELTRYLNGEPILARPIGAVTRAWRWCLRRPFVAASLVLAAVLFLAIGLGLPLLISQQQALKASEFQRLADVARVRELRARQELAEAAQKQELERRRQAEALAEANAARAATQEYHAKIGQVREARTSKVVGWTWQTLDGLQQAMELPADGKNETELRSLVAESLLVSDAIRQSTEWGQGELYDSLAFSHNGRFLAAAQTFGSPTSSIHLYEVHPDFSRSDFPELKLDKVRSLSIFVLGDKLKSLFKKTGLSDTATPGFRSVAFSRDDKFVAAGTRGGRVALWSLESDSAAPLFEVPVSKTQPPAVISQVAFAPDGTQLFAWSADGLVSCLQTSDGALMGEPLAGSRFVVLGDGSISLRAGDSLKRLYFSDKNRVNSAPKAVQAEATVGYDGNVIVAPHTPHAMLVSAQKLSDGIPLEHPPAMELNWRMTGGFTADSSLLFGTSGQRKLSMWNGLSGEFVNLLESMANSDLAVAVHPQLGSVALHGNKSGVIFRPRWASTKESSATRIESTGKRDLKETRPPWTTLAVDSGSHVDMSLSRDGRSLFTLSKSGTSKWIRRLDAVDGTPQQRWQFEMFVQGTYFTSLEGLSLTASHRPGEVFTGMEVPGVFTECHDNGFNMLESPWHRCRETTPILGEPNRAEVELGKPDLHLKSLCYRPTLALHFPRGLDLKTEDVKITLHVNKPELDRTYTLSASHVDAKGWYLWQFEELSYEAVAEGCKLMLELSSPELKLAVGSSLAEIPAESAQQTVMLRFGTLCGIRVGRHMMIGPVASQADGVRFGILDGNSLVRWPKDSSQTDLEWQDAFNDFMSLTALCSGEQTTTFANMVGQGYQSNAAGNIEGLQKAPRDAERKDGHRVISAAQTPDGKLRISGNMDGDVTCYWHEADGSIRMHKQHMHNSPVTSVAVSRDMLWLATGAQSGQWRVWKKGGADEYELLFSVDMPTHAMARLEFSQDARQLLLLRENERGVRLLNLAELIKIFDR